MKRNSLLLALLIALSTPFAHSATVTTVKGQTVLIDLEGETVAQDDEFFLINPETQKKAAIIRIKKFKGEKALAEIVKGRADTGFTLQAKAASAAGGEGGASSAKAGGPLRSLKDSYGFLGGFIMNSMNADVSYNNGSTTTRSSTSMSGSGFAVGGYYDYTFTPSIVLRGYSGLEQFTAAGSASTAACAGTTNCTANITYLSFYGLGKWYVSQGTYRTWLGGGFGYLLALAKSSTALNESQISTNSVMTAAFGMDYQSSRKNYIPISLEYNLFPSSNTVKASQILIKAGWAWNL